MGFAFIDAAMFGMPIDAIVCGYAYAKPRHLLLYSLGAAVGSALGSLVVYAIGYKGGEVMLKKRMGEARFNRITASFEKRGFLLLTAIAMLPPPTPFKLFVLAAGMVEMQPWRFLSAIVIGRFARFTIESILVVRYGPHVIALLAEVLRHHLTAAIVAVLTLALLGWWFSRLRKGKPQSEAASELSE
jgi:membrane protein YqaA with SNARE-associated domain